LKESLLDRYDVDVFAHTWLEDPWREGSHEKYLPPKAEYDERINQVIKILQIYKPKSFSVDQYHIRQEYYQSNENYILYTRYCSMLESVYRVNELKRKYEEQNHFKYDCVIRCRYDWGLKEKFVFEQFNLKDNVYVLHIGKGIENHINDQFAFSSSERMDKWCDLYNHMVEMAEVVIRDNHSLAEMYKRTRNGPDNHDLYAAWNRTQNLGAVEIGFDAVSWRVGGAVQFA
jgi:hypothetical protein